MGCVMKRYPKYKNSGVEWLGKVPEHWDPVKIARLGRLTKANGGSKEDNVDSGIPCIRYGELYTTYEYVIRKSRTYIGADCLSAYTPIHHGEVLFAASGETFEDIGRSAVNLLQEAACCGGDVILLRPEVDLDPLFSGYALDSMASRAQKTLMGKGYTVVHIYADQLRDLAIAVPPQSEQKTIGKVLDRETARIDALIEKKTRFVELLKEKRQALITHAVTKGLDQKVKMKNSGVEWIGQVPEHWEISKLAYTTQEAGGKTPDTRTEAYWGGDVPWVSPKDMKQAEILDSIDKISDTAVRECGMRQFVPGTVLVVVRGMILAHSFPVAELKVPATINQDVKALEPDVRLRPAYLRLLLETAKNYVVSVLVAEAAHGTKVLRADVWRQLPVLLPSIEFQDQILGEIRHVSAAYDKLIGKVERSITLLKERRSALITAAVTGEIDLREQAA